MKLMQQRRLQMRLLSVAFLFATSCVCVRARDGDSHPVKDVDGHFRGRTASGSDRNLYDENSRIVGGVLAGIEEFKSQVAIFGEKGSFLCGGTLIASNMVLTAAHCIERAYSVKVGVHMKQDTSADTFQVLVKIAHPSYQSINHSDHDVAILLLDGHSTATPMILLDIPSLLVDGSNLTVAGWGKTQEGGQGSTDLRKVEVHYINNTECNSMYANGKNKTIITPDMLCAGVPGGGKDACQGDSGGPLMMISPDGNGTRDVLAGVVSWGYGCARAKYPGVYGRVSKVIPFIKRTMFELDSLSLMELRLFSVENNMTAPDSETGDETTGTPSPSTEEVTTVNSKYHFAHETCIDEFKRLRAEGVCHNILFLGKGGARRRCDWVTLRMEHRCTSDHFRYCCPELCESCNDELNEV